MISPKRFDIFSPLTVGSSEGLDAFRFYFRHYTVACYYCCTLVLYCSTVLYCIVCMVTHTYSKSLDQPGKVASPSRGQLSRKNGYFPVYVRA